MFSRDAQRSDCDASVVRVHRWPRIIGGMSQLWNDLAARASIALDEQRIEQLNRYLDLLFAGNERMNLTRITNRAAAEVQHIADALTLLPYIPAGALKLVDIGSGGGVPGIPLAIVRPDMKITLCESTQKKATFLVETATALGLKNVTVHSVRAEELGRSAARESFDIATARAVGAITWLAEWCLPLVKPRGKMLAMKGPRAAEELPEALKAIKLLGGGESTVHPVDLPGSSGLVIVEIRKVRLTSRRYPRAASEAKGNPIHGG